MLSSWNFNSFWRIACKILSYGVYFEEYEKTAVDLRGSE